MGKTGALVRATARTPRIWANLAAEPPPSAAHATGSQHADTRLDDHPEVEQIRRAGLPIVLVDSTALPEHGSIEIDDAAGARAAADHLIGLGHRDVLIIGVEPPAPAVGLDPDGVMGRRLRGYRDAFGAVGVDLADDRLIIGPASIDGGIAALRRAWEDGLRPTAILAMSDVMAIGALRALRELGLRVPEDVSVADWRRASPCATPPVPCASERRDPPPDQGLTRSILRASCQTLRPLSRATSPNGLA